MTASAETGTGKPVVLIVDDEFMIRTILQRALASRYTVLTASNPQEAHEVLGENHIDFMLTDVNMPGGSGIQLVEELQARQPDLPVAFLAAIIDEETQARIESLGAPLFIKPFDVQELISMLEILVPQTH
jgi:DNA-binding response OmpR family regulator